MADPFVAEIRIFPFNFAPTGWAFCNGQLIPISQNTALFALLGTFYGGDGKSTFALPDLRGSAPMFWGQGPGLSNHSLGEQSGSETVTLIQSEIPFHTHTLRASNTNGNSQIPTNRTLARFGTNNLYQQDASANLVTMAPQALAVAGNSLPHNNMMPYLTLNFCIAMQGVFPPRN
jgi:microcystin-dependent protein